jgi:hypothetical protein
MGLPVCCVSVHWYTRQECREGLRSKLGPQYPAYSVSLAAASGVLRAQFSQVRTSAFGWISSRHALSLTLNISLLRAFALD